MPPAFCLGTTVSYPDLRQITHIFAAQSVITGVSTSFLVGVIVILSYNTLRLVETMQTSNNNMSVVEFIHVSTILTSGSISIIRWHPYYLLPLVAFPCVSSAVQVAVFAQYDVVQPADDLRCDATHPIP